MSAHTAQTAGLVVALLILGPWLAAEMLAVFRGRRS